MASLIWRGLGSGGGQHPGAHRLPLGPEDQRSMGLHRLC